MKFHPRSLNTRIVLSSSSVIPSTPQRKFEKNDERKNWRNWIEETLKLKLWEWKSPSASECTSRTLDSSSSDSCCLAINGGILVQAWFLRHDDDDAEMVCFDPTFSSSKVIVLFDNWVYVIVLSCWLWENDENKLDGVKKKHWNFGTPICLRIRFVHSSLKGKILFITSKLFLLCAKVPPRYK